MSTEFLKLCVIRSRTRSEDRFFICKSSVYLSVPSLLAGAPSLRLLWRRHCFKAATSPNRKISAEMVWPCKQNALGKTSKQALLP